MKSFRQFIIKNSLKEDVPLNPPSSFSGVDYRQLQSLINKLSAKLGRGVSQDEIDRLIKLRNKSTSDARADLQGRTDAVKGMGKSSYDTEDPTNVKKPKTTGKTKLGDITKGGEVKIVKPPKKPPLDPFRPFGKPTGTDPKTGKATYTPPNKVPKKETGRRAERQKWDYQKVKKKIDAADYKRFIKKQDEYSPDYVDNPKRIKQSEVSSRARKYTAKINRQKVTSDADKFIKRLRKASKLQARMDTAVSTSQKPGTLSQKTNELLKSLRLKGKPKSSVISPKTYLSKGGQTSLFPDTHTVTPPPEPKTQRTSNWRKWRQTTLDFNKKTPKVTKNPQKTFNQMQKDISKVRGTKSTFPKSNLSYKIKNFVTKIPKTAVDPFTAIQGYARQRDVKNATQARAITGGLLKGKGFGYGFTKGASLSTAAALKVTKHPAYVGAAGLVGGLTGGILTSTGTEFAFDKLLGKRGTRTATQTQTQKEKTKNKNKVITANPKNNKGIILPPGEKKKKKPVYFALNPAKVSK